jgi:uncharacterized membrane protein YvlD (DUF360 family)
MQRINLNFRLIRKLVGRYSLVWLADTISIALTALLLPGIYFIRDAQFWYLYPFLVALLFGLLNALVRPVLILLLLPITFVTLGLATLLLNSALFYVMHFMVDSFVIESFSAAVIGLLLLTLVNTLLGNLIQLGDDYSFYATMMNKFSSLTRPRKLDAPGRGLVVLQVDGLSYRTLKKALRKGKMPFLQDMLKRRRFVLRSWHSGLPSQTSSVQAGMLYGDNFDIPGFRWYDKDTGKRVTSSSSSDMNALDERIGTDSRPLLESGSCINSIIHGGARKKILTISALSDTDIKQHISELEDFAIFSLHPYLYTRTILLMVWDFLVDRTEALMDLIRRKKPPVRRGIKFSIFRAIGNTFFREATTHFIIEDIVRGIPIIYANYVGYDMVAHYGGPDSWDAMSTLAGIDRQIKKISRTIRRKATKHFDVVVLSDHGQSKCVPFRLLYGKSLASFIEEKLNKRLVERSESSAEMGYFESLLREMRLVDRAYGTRSIRRSRKTLERIHTRVSDEIEEAKVEDSIVVCVSGNLAHIYFTESPGRLTTEYIIRNHPALLESLVTHPGIGFAVTTREDGEFLMMGRNGLRMMRSGEVEGEDPALQYLSKNGGESNMSALIRLCEYPHAGDLILNGAVIKEGTVVSFENQRGTHGGLGGEQTAPFVIYPRRFRTRGDRIEHPLAMHSFLMSISS